MSILVGNVRAGRVTDEMFIEAAQAVADQVPSDMFKQGLLYPLQSNILETEIQTAARVALHRREHVAWGRITERVTAFPLVLDY